MVLYERSGDDIDRGLVGFWKLDDLKVAGTTLAIDKINFSDGTITGATNTTGINGINPDAMLFDGTGDYVDVGNVDFLGDFAISAWINPIRSDRELTILGKGRGDNPDVAGLEIVYSGTSANDPITVFINNGTGTTILIKGLTFGIDNKWTNILVNFNRAGNIAIYLDGVELTYTTGIDISSKQGSLGSNNLLIGRYGSYGGYDWNGSMANVRFYNRVLTKGEISKLYRLRL